MSSSSPDYPHTEKLEARFIKAVQEKGITHVLTWIDQWYAAEAEAFVADQARNTEAWARSEAPGKWTNKQAEQEARHLITLLVAYDCSSGRDPFRQSSSIGATARDRALLSTCMDIIKREPSNSTPISGVVLRDGNPVLVRENEIRPSDVRLSVQGAPQETMKDWIWSRIGELRDKYYVPDAETDGEKVRGRPGEQ